MKEKKRCKNKRKNNAWDSVICMQNIDCLPLLLFSSGHGIHTANTQNVLRTHRCLFVQLQFFSCKEGTVWLIKIPNAQSVYQHKPTSYGRNSIHNSIVIYQNSWPYHTLSYHFSSFSNSIRKKNILNGNWPGTSETNTQLNCIALIMSLISLWIFHLKSLLFSNFSSFSLWIVRRVFW